MFSPMATKAKKRSTSMTLDADLLDEAKRYGINVSKAAEGGVGAVVRAERWRRWQEEHRQAFEAHNRWIEENGLPFADIRVDPFKNA